MRLNPSATELTTALTDAALGVLCLGLLVWLMRMPLRAPWKKTVWGSVFGLLAVASVLGALAHGLDLSEPVRAALWQPLYLSLGLTVALFLVGAIGDWRGERAGRALFPWAIAAGAGFFAITRLSDGSFLVFIAYEAVAMLSALAIYLFLWTRGLAGAGLVAIGIGLTLVAAAIQVSHLSVNVIVPLDHNGLFHVVQLVAVVVMANGLRRGLTSGCDARGGSSPRPARL
jgi:hypothetical protein